jgi:hypothetical protein
MKRPGGNKNFGLPGYTLRRTKSANLLCYFTGYIGYFSTSGTTTLGNLCFTVSFKYLSCSSIWVAYA